MSKEITVTSKNFDEEVKKSPIPVLLDFWAEWCVPCKMIGPILEEIAGEYEGKLKVAKINVDDEGLLAGQYNVVSIPTLMVFKDGDVVKQQVGAGSRQAIEEIFKPFL